MSRVVIAAVAALLAVPVAASARVIRAESVLPPGQSGHVPRSGSNPHLTDQVALFEAFAFKSAAFDQLGTTEAIPGATITRDAYGVPNVRAANDRDLWRAVGYATAQNRWSSSARSLPVRPRARGRGGGRSPSARRARTARR